MAHVSEDYGAAPPDALAVRARETATATPRPAHPHGKPAHGRPAKAYAAVVRRKIAAFCPAPLKALPA